MEPEIEKTSNWKKYLAVAIAILLIIVVISFVTSAQTNSEIATPSDVQTAGITPDSKLWGFEIAFERITEMFSEKAKLRHAQERLAEVKVLIATNRQEHVEKARKEMDRIYNEVENKSMLDEHKALMDTLGQRIRQYTALTPGPMNESLREQVKELIEEHKVNLTREVEEIKNEIAPDSIAKNETNNFIGMKCPEGSEGHALCSRLIAHGQCVNGKCEAPEISQGGGYTYYCYSDYCITGGQLQISRT